MKSRESASLWRAAMEIFLGAIDREEDAREGFIAEACGGDDGLESAVRRLLRADRVVSGEELPDIVRLRAAATEAGPSLVGETLAPYQVVDKIGDGGMGSVYLARRMDGLFEQTVAIKVLRTAVQDPTRVQRFRREREILARLSHPAVARLIDGGETANGLPYLVMEHVAGESLFDYCRGRDLGLEERLQLFLAVCAAIEYAHRNLVIHRDIKPNNILVDSEGMPKVLDFGIAKLLSEEAEASAPGEAAALTPDYASPEQILGLGLTTTTDVYSLGVLLYELLTDRRPFDRGTITERDEESLRGPVAPPSSAVRGARGDRLEGELDAIVLKALAFEPEARYESVAALTDDLRRYLAGRTVRAVGDHRWYRARKLVSRNRVSFAAAALALVLTVFWAVTALIQSRRVRDERDVATQVTRFLVESYERVDPNHARGESLTAREVLDDAARRIEEELGGQPEVKSRLQRTLAEVYLNLGLYEAAAKLARESRSLLAGSSGPCWSGRSPPARTVDYAEATLIEARLLHQRAEYDEALELLALAQSIFVEAGDRAASARVRHAEASVRYDQGDREEALALDEEAWAQEIGVLGPDDPQTLAGAFAVSKRLAVLGRDAEATALQDETLDRLRALGLEVYPLTAELLRQIAVRERRAGRLEAAESYFADALRVQRALYGDRHPSIARTTSSFGNLRATQGRYEEALELFDAATGMSDSVFGRDETYAAIIRFNRGFLLQRMGRVAEAEADMRQALEMRRRILGERTWSTANTALFLAAHGETLLSLGRLEEASEAAERSLRVWRERDQVDDRNGCLARIILAEIHLDRAEWELAEEHLTLCYPILRDSPGLDPTEIERGRSRLERLYRLTGRIAEADELVETG